MNITPPPNSASSTMLGISIDRIFLEQATEQAMDAINGQRGQIAFACANPHSLVIAQGDQTFFNALSNTDQLVADGSGIILGGRLVGIEVGPRIAGAEYFFAVLNALQTRGKGKVFFFGSSEHVLGRIRQRMSEKFPGIEVCGTISPPFREWSEEENDRMVQIINASQPDVLWVGMTAPKQEKWVFANRNILQAPVIGSIGAVFDFFAGTHPRAPGWMCAAGIEWLYRLVREPRRMWRRNFVSTPRFLYLILRERIFGLKDR